ncbi:MAG: hypothetical protein PHV12_02280 [Bacteroidales bacterium]|jgi:hypothetical protein|nr:hypothetical protein [Bacteroidales bacterium]MDD3272537.1 hypothetical protein [Bacteroidales bacterium]
MYVDVFQKDFVELGRRLNLALSDELNSSHLHIAMSSSSRVNPYFTIEMQRSAIISIANYMLNEDALRTWIRSYGELLNIREEYIGVIAAGNIPAVGFHDILSVLASGFKCEVKLSKKDRFILPVIINILAEINPFWEDRVLFVAKISTKIRMLIASGSDSTMNIIGSEYCLIPTLLRGSKSSLAVLDGKESNVDIDLLCDDLFLYFGMGCRSISKLFVPYGYDFSQFLQSSQRYLHLLENDEYFSSYKYQKAIMTLSGESFIDGNFFILSEVSDFPPPLALVGIHYYSNIKEIEDFILLSKEKIQVIEWKQRTEYLSFGQSQKPGPSEYADGVDTISFLLSLGQK